MERDEKESVSLRQTTGDGHQKLPVFYDQEKEKGGLRRVKNVRTSEERRKRLAHSSKKANDVYIFPLKCRRSSG